MITEYKQVNGKVVASDDSVGLKIYDYQDNIDEVLKQENIVEDIDYSLKKLYSEKDWREKHTKGFLDYYFSDGSLLNVIYGISIIAMLTLGSSVPVIGESVIFKLAAIIYAFGVIPATNVFQYKKYKKANKLRLINLNEQIREFENKCIKELEKLSELRETKKQEDLSKNISSETIYINNGKIESISNIKNRKKIYEYYRGYCLKIKKFIAQHKLVAELEDEFSDDEIRSLMEMSDSANKTLQKTNK